MASIISNDTAKAAQEQLKRVTGPGFLCLLSIISFILSDPILSSAIITFLTFLETEIVVQQTAISVLIQQANVTLAILNTELQSLQALASIGNGLNSRFPLAKLMACNSFLKDIINQIFGNSTSQGSALLTKLTNIQAQVQYFIRDKQYKAALLQKRINQLSQTLAQLDLGKSQIEALITFIKALQNLPILPTLPIP